MDTVWRRFGRFGVASAIVALLALAIPGCKWIEDLEDDLSTCHDWTVRLTNDEQTLGSVHIIGPDEGARPDTLLVSGQSRSMVLCLDLGHGYSFRAESEDGAILAAVKCPASRRHYDGITPSVVWTPIGFRCIDW